MHSSNLIPLYQITKMQLSQEISQVQILQRRVNHEYESILRKAINMIETIKKSLQSHLDSLQEKLSKHIFAGYIPSHTRYWDSVLEEYETFALNSQHDQKEILKKLIHIYSKLKQTKSELQQKYERKVRENEFIVTEATNLRKALEERLQNSFKFPSNKNDTKNVFINELNIERYIEAKGGSSPHSITYLKPRELIAIGDHQGFLNIYDGNNFKRISTTCIDSQNRYGIKHIHIVKYAPQRDLLFYATTDNAIKISKVSKEGKLKLLKTIVGHNTVVQSILILEEKSLFISSEWGPNLKIWDLKSLTPKDIIRTKGMQHTGREMVYLPKYNLIAVAFQDGYIGLYDLETKNPVYHLPTHSQHCAINSVLYLENKNLLVVGISSGQIKCWTFDKETPTIKYEFNFAQDIIGRVIPINGNESLLIARNASNLIKLNLAENKSYELVETECKELTSLAYDEKKRRILSGDSRSNKITVFKY